MFYQTFFRLNYKVLSKHLFKSVCMPPNHSSKWIQQNIEYIVLGPSKKEDHSYANCYQDVIKKFESNLNAPKEIQLKDVYAFSFFYDRLNAAKVFNKSYHGEYFAFS